MAQEVIEQWKPIKDFERYEISNLGRIRRKLKNGQFSIIESRGQKYKKAVLSKTRGGDLKHFYLHRLVWESFNGSIPKGMHTDHVNRDSSDNRLENLRLAEVHQNAYNSRRRSRSPYKGVEKMKYKFCCRLQLGKTRIYKGNFNTAEEAALEYNRLALQYHGEFAVLNEVKENNEWRQKK